MIYMHLISFARVIKFSFQDIFRNIWLSIVTVIILILALFTINMLLTVQVLSDSAIKAVKEKVDVSVFLNPELDESSILSLKERIENFKNVKSVEYTSRAQALENFRLKYQNNPSILQALQEIGKNPLSPSLVIKPGNVSEFDSLVNELNKIEDDLIESRNFTDHSLILNKINAITDRISEVGLGISFLFAIIALLVVYNSVRVAIYTHRKEIAIMRLVGASSSFVYMPFILSSIIYALVGVIVAIAIYYPFLTLLQPYLEAFFVDYNVNLLAYYNQNFIAIFGWQFIGAALVGIVASLLAAKKYSKI